MCQCATTNAHSGHLSIPQRYCQGRAAAAAAGAIVAAAWLPGYWTFFEVPGQKSKKAFLSLYVRLVGHKKAYCERYEVLITS